MNSFTLHTLETAPAESKALLTAVATRFGFLPNVYAYLAEAPVALEALAQLSAIFSRTSLTEPQRHLLLLTSSVENQCSFCVAAHTRGAKAGARTVCSSTRGQHPHDLRLLRLGLGRPRAASAGRQLCELRWCRTVSVLAPRIGASVE